MLPPKVRLKAWRCHLTIPGILSTALPTRWSEFHYTAFSPYAVELVCFDLRKRREHEVTRPFAEHTPAVQDAIDRAIVAHYVPGRDREFGLMAQIIDETKAVAAEAVALNPSASTLPTMEVTANPARVFFPATLRAAIEQRWEELGFRSLSAYVTSLARYDLMLGGPHYYFSGKDKDPELLAALDLRTLRAFHAHKRQRILLDYLIDRAAGRELSDDERKTAIANLVTKLRDNALRSQKETRRRAG